MLNITKHELRKSFKNIREQKFRFYENHLEEKNHALRRMQEKIGCIIDRYCAENNKSKEIIVSSYYPIQSELDCLSILKNIRNETNQSFFEEIIICLPKTFNKQKVMKFYEYTNDENLVLGKYGIKEPDINICREVVPDIILTPLLAFDVNKHRLGYGKGHYDNTFNHLKEINHNFISVGVAYDEQFYDDILPTDQYDINLDFIVTPIKLI